MAAPFVSTKPRGPIAAMYSSPGPCYKLPGLIGKLTHDPRSCFAHGPAYTLSYRHGKFKDECSPGPCYLPDPAINRTGRKGDPHYSLYSRPRDCAAFRTPGPGSYCPESVGEQAHYRAPKYSFGTRSRNKETDCTPGPNIYTLPNVVGSKTIESSVTQAPVYSLRGKQVQGSFCEDLGKTPGPGTYKVPDPNTTRSKAAQYSMISRNLVPGDNTQKPGPGAHSPERVTINRPQAPGCSFGIRHSQYLTPLIHEVYD